ncbi:hypothetical protein [Variovorax gossypii]
MAGMDDFYADAQLQRQQHQHTREMNALAAQYQAVIDQVAAERDGALRELKELLAGNAGNLALRYAYAEALAQIDPEHPLIVDPGMRDRIAKLAKETILATNDWDQVREVGRTFKVPPSTLAVERDKLVRQYDTVSGQNAGNLALRYSFAVALAEVAPNHPLVRDAALRDRIAKHGSDTIFKTHDWDQVREVGKTYSIPSGG